MKESRKHVCGIERPSKLVYIYHALLVLKRGEPEEKPEEKLIRGQLWRLLTGFVVCYFLFS
jgi:hypothetical protein